MPPLPLRMGRKGGVDAFRSRFFGRAQRRGRHPRPWRCPVVAGFEVDLAQLGLGGKVHTESAAGQIKAGIAPQDGHAVALAVVQIDGILSPHLVHRAEKSPGQRRARLWVLRRTVVSVQAVSVCRNFWRRKCRTASTAQRTASRIPSTVSINIPSMSGSASSAAFWALAMTSSVETISVRSNGLGGKRVKSQWMNCRMPWNSQVTPCTTMLFKNSCSTGTIPPK